ncbi:hypothetical protein MHU86_22445 [Fragilaria crotonensis]|nr:hypothetical protein MHU86_22445 [Fragilaria crotonensis]
MKNRGSADDVAKNSARAGGMQEDDFAEEYSSDLPSMSMPLSAPSGSSPYASLSLPSAAKVDDRSDVLNHGAGRVGDTTKKLEHALPTDPRMQLPARFGMVDSMGRPPVAYARNSSDVGPGAFRVRSARNTATGRTVRSPIGSYASPRELTNEESKQEDGVPNSAAAGMGVYSVEAQRVPDGNEDGAVLVAEAQYVRTKWYQRRWITLGLALFACGLVVALVVMVVLLLRQPSAAGTTTPSLASLAIACNFLSIPDVTDCQSTFSFSGSTTGSTIPSEIGLLTQLTYLSFYNNALTSSIPSEIALLTKLERLSFEWNDLTGTIPSSLCSLPSLEGNIYIDDGEVRCLSGCCFCIYC